MSLPHVRRASRRRAFGVTAVAALLALPVGADAAQPPVTVCSNPGATTRVGLWQAFRAPLFEPAPGVEAVSQNIVAFAVDPRRPDRMFATNGNSIQRSRDGGCTWQEVVTLPAVPDPNGLLLPGTTVRIRLLAVDPTGSGRVWAVAEEGATAGAAGRPHVAYSDTGEPGSWQLGDQGLPPVGRPTKLEPAPGSGRVVYLSFAGTEDESLLGDGSPGVLWGSTDGGATWTPRSDARDFGNGAALRDFAVDHGDPSGRTLWAVVGGALRQSTDGGATYQVPDGLPQSSVRFRVVEALPTVESIRVVAFAPRRMLTLSDSGAWKESPGPDGTPESVAYRMSALPGELAVAVEAATAKTAVHVGQLGKPGWRQVTPPGGLAGRAAIQGTTSARPTYFVRSDRVVLRYIGPPDAVPRPPRDKVPPYPGGDPAPVRGRITPAITTLSIPAGQQRTVDYTLELPKSPTPLDVFLLIDTSESMANVLNKLKTNLGNVTQRLLDAGVSVRAGVGTIGVQPDSKAVTLEPAPLYTRLRKIGPIDDEFAERLRGVRTHGAAGDEAQLEALYQVVTGRGMRVVSLLPAYSIPPGQDAKWRGHRDVLKVILHATNEVFSRNIQNGHNDAAYVGEVLRSNGVYQIGLSANIEAAHRDLADMARRTGAVARGAGVDCDADGVIAKRPGSILGDVLPGAPLVCPGIGDGFERTLFEMLDSIIDRKPVELTASRSEVVVGMTPRSVVIDVKRDVTIPFSVTYSCRGRAAGDYPVDLAARLRGDLVARAAATITCGSVAGALARPPIVHAVPPQQANPQPAPLAPPMNPAPQAQSQVQTQTQVNPQAGAAEQEQEQVNVATAVDDLTDDQPQQTLAMSRRTTADDPALLVAALGLAAAAGAAAYRQRTQAARAEVRRRGR